MTNDTITFSGYPTITLIGPDGNIKETIQAKNLVVTAGKNFLMSRALGTSAGTMSHMAVGTGNTAPLAADTTLQTELARVALSSASAVGSTITYAATFPAGTGTGAITEAGIFNASSSGTMLARVTFSVVNKDAADSLSVSWNVIAN